MSPPPSKCQPSTVSILKAPTPGLVPDDAVSKPHHVIGHGGKVVGYKNPYPSAGRGTNFYHFATEAVWPRLMGRLKYPDIQPPNVSVVKPEFLVSRSGSQNLRMTWLGHSCCYVEFPSGLRVLFDPVFEERCSPSSVVGTRRFTSTPCNLTDLPAVDAVFISHNHYDHLSYNSVRELQRVNPGVHFFVGMGVAEWFIGCGIKRVTEMDWWEDTEIRVDTDSSQKDGAEILAQISCTPCQHNSGRKLWDTDKTLWCSWAVKSGDKSVWFGGDTGYRAVPHTSDDVDDYGPEFQSLEVNPQFAQIGQLKGPFDLGLIPIGAYAPRGLFSPVHANPFDSVEIFEATRCKKAVGIHWGTWMLTFEDVLEPPRLLKEALRRKGIEETGVFDVLDIGQSGVF